jgi:HlyD family secretion protein
MMVPVLWLGSLYTLEATVKKFIAICFGLALALAACGPDGIQPFGRSKEQGDKRTGVVKATGTLQPQEIVDIGAQVSGTILKLGADPNDEKKTIDWGTKVKAGTVLAQLDPASYQAALAQAQADLQRAEASLRLAVARAALAERELKRTKKREADKIVDSLDVDVAKAAVDVAKAVVTLEERGVAQNKAAIRTAELNLSYCTIRSPIDGVVIDRRVNVGQAVTAKLDSPSLFLLAKDLNKLEVWASVKEADIPRVKKGQLAHFTFDAFPKETFKGRVTRVQLNAVMAAKEGVTFTVVIDVDNSDGKLLPYLTAQVLIETAEGK